VTTLVLTVVGDDRLGLVKALSGIVADNGGNWEQSHLAELAGTFAGIVVITVPERRAAQLQSALTTIEGLLDVSVRPTTPAPATRPITRARLELVGNDRPGIVAAVSDVIARHQIGVADLQTATREAPMAGGMLFEASAIVTVESEDSLDQLRTDLEHLASEVLVDVAISDLT
jgi:glycine cleavage system regulatory protein